jgi:hypothetical protein
MKNEDVEPKKGPMTLIAEICDIASSTRLLTVTAIALGLGIILLSILIFATNEIAKYFCGFGILMFAILQIVSVVAVKNKTNELEEKALEATRLYDEEILARGNDQFEHSLKDASKKRVG